MHCGCNDWGDNVPENCKLEVDVSGKGGLASVVEKVKYCPFCGRRLERDTFEAYINVEGGRSLKRDSAIVEAVKMGAKSVDLPVDNERAIKITLYSE